LRFLENMWRIWSEYWTLFLGQGLAYTLILSLIAVSLGLVGGTLLVFMKRSNLKPLQFISTAIVEVVRGTPMLLQIFVAYFLVPKVIPALKQLPLEPRQFISISVALAINSSAYVSEVIRSGIQAVDRGQNEAARSLGLNARQAMFKVVMPQAVRNILPALGNEFITVIKETSLASTFFVGDLMTTYKIINGATYLTLEPLTILAIIYFILTFTLSRIVRMAERRLWAGD
jgi:His/Glu/Gln/Arg/opine family amino acid ABC transporter permease subunit